MWRTSFDTDGVVSKSNRPLFTPNQHHTCILANYSTELPGTIEIVVNTVEHFDWSKNIAIISLGLFSVNRVPKM